MADSGTVKITRSGACAVIQKRASPFLTACAMCTERRPATPSKGAITRDWPSSTSAERNSASEAICLAWYGLLGFWFRRACIVRAPNPHRRGSFRAHGIGPSQICLIAPLFRFPGLYLGFEGIDSGRLFCARCLECAVIQQRQHLAAPHMISTLHADRSDEAVRAATTSACCSTTSGPTVVYPPFYGCGTRRRLQCGRGYQVLA